MTVRSSICSYPLLTVEVCCPSQWVHIFYVCCLFKTANVTPHVYARLVGIIVQTFGGSLTVGVLLGLPSTLLLSNFNLPALLVAYVLVFHVPLVHRLLTSTLVWPFMTFFDWFNTCFSVIHGATIQCHHSITQTLPWIDRLHVPIVSPSQAACCERRAPM